jgi:hypothetical protein
VNCHPTLKLQVCEKMGVAAAVLQQLKEYISSREAVLGRISDWYGVSREWAKEGVLRVLNGGSVAAWIRDSGGSSAAGDQSDLRALERVAAVAEAKFFELYEDASTALIADLTASKQAAVRAAEQRLAGASARQRQAMQRELQNARLKATDAAIKRSVFSYCVFQLEDEVLDVVVKHFESKGLTVSSLQYDGCHVEHVPGDQYDRDIDSWVQLEAAMRGAEDAVLREMGYTIKLKEKPLYSWGLTEDEGEGLSDADDQSASEGDVDDS